MANKHKTTKRPKLKLTISQKLSDQIAKWGGSWYFIIGFFVFLSVPLMPQFDGVVRICRLALYQGQAHSMQVLHLLPFTLLTATAFLGGYGFTSKKIRSLT